MVRKITRRRISLGDKPTPPPVKPKPKGPRSTSAKQAGQAAKKVSAPKPKPAPRPKPSVASQLGKAAADAAKSTAKFSPVGRATAAVGAIRAAAGLAGKTTTKSRFPKATAAVAVAKNPNFTSNRAAAQIGVAATAAAYGGATAKYRSRTGAYPAGSPAKKTATSTRRIPGMTATQARQEVALTKRAQERKKEATGTPKKKITAKQTAYRELRRMGTSREAFKLSKANRNRPRG